MNITDLLREDIIDLDIQSGEKEAALDELIHMLDQAGNLQDKAAFKAAILTRESQSTTGIGEAIAIPHAKSAAVKAPSIAFGRSTNGVAFESLDGQPAHLLFMIAATDGANNEHLAALSRLSTFLMDTDFRQKLYDATTTSDVIKAITDKEAALAKEEAPKTAEKSAPKTEGYRVLAVTACPTGIAHTYMAAEKLNETGKTMGTTIKVETNGSSGVKNQLTADEIAAADGIIVAADTKVDMARFAGKHVIQVPVAKGIREAEDLINRALSQDAPVYEHDAKQSNDTEASGRSGVYKHLMNGVSNMLPFVVGGGILIALSFFWGINAADPDSPEYNAFAWMLNEIGGGKAFFLMVPVLAGFIASSIADRPGFAPGMVGGLIAITVSGTEGAAGSGFLGGLIAGFLAGYVTLLVKKAFEKLPDSLEGLKPVLFFPVFSIAITGLIMMTVNPYLTTIYTSLSTFLESMGGSNALLVGLILGAMMAFDMGGPFNKAAYTFGIAMLDAGNFTFMAAVMAAGMVPPLGVALATSLFKKRFTKEEQAAGKTAYVLGASFITEGVIPFAAADPARVIPAIVAGASVTGGLTMLFDIGLRAPHGGLFVIGLLDGGIGKIILYILAILVGTLITAILVGLLKKDIKQ